MRKYLIAAIFGCLSLVGFWSLTAQAVTLTDCNQLGLDSNECSVVNENNLEGNDNIIKQAIQVAMWALVSVAVIVRVVSGIQFALSQGDAAKVKKARQTILYAVVGLVVALAASVIVNFVIENIM